MDRWLPRARRRDWPMPPGSPSVLAAGAVLCLFVLARGGRLPPLLSGGFWRRSHPGAGARRTVRGLFGNRRTHLAEPVCRGRQRAPIRTWCVARSGRMPGMGCRFVDVETYPVDSRHGCRVGVTTVVRGSTLDERRHGARSMESARVHTEDDRGGTVSDCVRGTRSTRSAIYALNQSARRDRFAVRVRHPVIAVMLGALFAGERFSPRIVAAAALVLGGVAIVRTGPRGGP